MFGIKSHLLSLLLRTVCGIRTLVFVFAVVITSAIMSMLSAFAGITYVIYQYKVNGNVVFDGVLIFFCAVFVLSIFVFSMLMCEKFWIKILKIDRLVKDVATRRGC